MNYQDERPMVRAQADLLLERAARSTDGAVYLDGRGRRDLDDLGLDTLAVDHAANVLVAEGLAELTNRHGTVALVPTPAGQDAVPVPLRVVRERAA